MQLLAKLFTDSLIEMLSVKSNFSIRSIQLFYNLSDEKLVAVSVSGVTIFTIDRNNKKVFFIFLFFRSKALLLILGILNVFSLALLSIKLINFVTVVLKQVMYSKYSSLLSYILDFN
jgi:hypothetical protein